jgi:hypothetical protein
MQILLAKAGLKLIFDPSLRFKKVKDCLGIFVFFYVSLIFWPSKVAMTWCLVNDVIRLPS